MVSREDAFENCILPVLLKISATTVQGMNLITLDSIPAYKWKQKETTERNQWAEWKFLFFLIMFQFGVFWKLFLSLSFYYPQVPEILFDGRQLHPTQVDKPWKNASDNQTLERCICNGFFQCKRNQCSKVRALAQLLLSDTLMAACKVT